MQFKELEPLLPKRKARAMRQRRKREQYCSLRHGYASVWCHILGLTIVENRKDCKAPFQTKNPWNKNFRQCTLTLCVIVIVLLICTWTTKPFFWSAAQDLRFINWSWAITCSACCCKKIWIDEHWWHQMDEVITLMVLALSWPPFSYTDSYLYQYSSFVGDRNPKD